MTDLETDYLIVGAGASGMAVADELIANTDAEVVIVDRRHRHGGHPGVVRVQRVQVGIDPFCAAMVGYVEATRDNDHEKNRLCPPMSFFDSTADFVPGFLHSQRVRLGWFADPDVRDWLTRSRLTPLRDAGEHLTDPKAQAAIGRLIAMTGPAIENLERIMAATPNGAAQ